MIIRRGMLFAVAIFAAGAMATLAGDTSAQTTPAATPATVELTPDIVGTDAPVVATTGETIVVSEDNVITIPYGNYIEDLGDIFAAWIVPLLGGIVAWLLTYVPQPLRWVVRLMMTKQAEQMLQRSIEYGINAVEGATKGKKLEFSVGSVVLAKAVNSVIANASDSLIDFLGGQAGIEQKILARLDLAPEATAANMGVTPVKPTIAPGVSKPKNRI